MYDEVMSSFSIIANVKVYTLPQRKGFVVAGLYILTEDSLVLKQNYKI